MPFDVKLYAKNQNRMMQRRMQASENLKHKIESNRDDDQTKQDLALLDKEKIRSQRINPEIGMRDHDSEGRFVLESNYCYVVFSSLPGVNPRLNQVIKKLTLELKNHKNKKYTISQLNSILESFDLNMIEQYIILKQFYLNNNSFEQDDNIKNQFSDVARDKIKQLANEKHSEILSDVKDNIAASIKSRIDLSESFIQNNVNNNVNNYQVAYLQSTRKIIELSHGKDRIDYEKSLSESIINFGHIIELCRPGLKNDFSFETKDKIRAYSSAINNAQKVMNFLDSCSSELGSLPLSVVVKGMLDSLDRFNLKRIYQGTPNLSMSYTESAWAAKSINVINGQPENFFRKEDKDNCINNFESLISGTTKNRVYTAYL